MVLGKLPVPERPTDLDKSRARAYCACSRCGWGVVWTFFLSSIISLFFLPLSLGEGPIWTEILSQRAVKPENNQPTNFHGKLFCHFDFCLFKKTDQLLKGLVP